MVFRVPDAKHFTDQGKKPGAVFHELTCKGCDEYFGSLTPPQDNVTTFPNRSRSLSHHVRRCPHHAARLLRVAAAGGEPPGPADASASCGSVSPGTAASASTAATPAAGSADAASPANAETTAGAVTPTGGRGTPTSSAATHSRGGTRPSTGVRRSQITSYIDSGYTEEQQALVRKRALQWMCANHLPFDIFTQPSTQRLFESVRTCSVPLVKSFTPRAMSEKYLQRQALETRAKALPEVKRLRDEGCAVGLRIDAWESTAHREIVGVMVGTGITWFAYEDALGTGSGNVGNDEAYHGIATAKKLESAIMNVSTELTLPVSCVCTDEAGEMSRAKKILSLRWPAMYFLKCYAHQVNRLARDVLVYGVFARVTGVISRMLTTISRSKVWRNRLRNIAKQIYGTEHTLIQPTTNRWNSFQASFAQLLRLRSAIQSMLIRHRDERTRDMEEMHTEGHVLWPALERAEGTLRPVAKASMVMQREDNSLADVVHIYGMVCIMIGKKLIVRPTPKPTRAPPVYPEAMD
eukprot:GHVU01189141.1.p1 GENE.GHVU01189141.1~~GHVU01189141.1.p1  ORF type:complete len:522 (-),score=40.40 GHVU01189141.1:38-1603(-)